MTFPDAGSLKEQVKNSVFALLLGATCLFSQSERVVATVNGLPVTAAEIEDFVKGLPNQFLQLYQQDKAGFLKQYAVLLKFSKLAEDAKVDQSAPYKQRLQFMRMQILSQALVEDYRSKIQVKEEDIASYYEKNKENYTQAKLQVLLVGYGEKPKPSEEEALNKAEGLVKQLRGGADFAKLVKENSDDVASKAKGGEFGTIRRSDQIPEELKKAIFSLKVGEYSDPVKQPNGFYIFRVVDYTVQPLEEVKGVLTTQLRDQVFQEWLKTTQEGADAKIEDPAYFGKP